MNRIILGIKTLFLLIITFVITACGVDVPKNVVPINNFKADQYLGEWYEIARIDNRFEKNMINVTANYSLRDDDGIKVVNRGFDPDKQEWNESIGKAYFTSSPDVAALKVSFFGPFYGGYNVVKLDDDYKVALVAGSSNDYLWILARTPCISEQMKTAYVQKAQEIGYDVTKLNFNIQSSCSASK